MPAEAQSPGGEAFGARLRRERERHQIAIESIAENTKISASLLAALERGDASRWPTGIFRRSFFRAYAEAIGVDVEATTREFLQLFPDPNDLDRIVEPPPPAAAASRTQTFWEKLANARRFFSLQWVVQVRIVKRRPHV